MTNLLSKNGIVKFSELDDYMRVYETAHDLCVLPGIYMVARIDGRSFTKLTKDKCQFEAPFDSRFRDLMVETTKHLMECGFKVVYAYTESDEISLLFDLKSNVFSRKLRKYHSVLAGEASAKFSLLLQNVAAFDCRICQLPTKANVIDYFRWRNEDAHRNALNAYCYWLLRKQGQTKTQATSQIAHKSVAEKNELLFSLGVNFNDVPDWQKRGIGLYWIEEEKIGFNQRDKVQIVTSRKVIKTNYNLPMKDVYSDFISGFLDLD